MARIFERLNRSRPVFIGRGEHRGRPEEFTRTDRLVRAGHRWSRRLSLLGDLFMPPVCLRCSGHRWGSTPLCLSCLKKLSPLRGHFCARCGIPDCGEPHADWIFPFASTRFIFRMAPELSVLIHGFKYRHQLRHLRFLCAYMRYRPDMLAYAREFDAIVPVPLHRSRLRERGYNQAEVIARALSELTGLPVLKDVLRRSQQTQSQTKLGRKDRQNNLSRVFECVKPDKASGLRLLLVDDVFTTGATTAQCAALLGKAGGESMGVFALAKVETGLDQDDFEREMEVAAGYVV